MVKWNNIIASWTNRKPTWTCWLFHRSYWTRQRNFWWFDHLTDKDYSLCKKCVTWWEG